MTKKKASPKHDNPIKLDEFSLNESIGMELNWFLDHLSSLVSTIGPLMMLLKDIGKEFRQNKSDFEKEHCKFGKVKKLRDNSKILEIAVPLDKRMEWKKLVRKDKAFYMSYKLIPRSVFVSFISIYDAYISKLLRILFLIKPEILNSSDKKISLSDIVNFSNLTDAREWIIEKEVEDVLRKSHVDQLKYIEDKFSLKIKPEEEIYRKFIELTERRNLFVHCDGIISKQYLNACAKNKINIGDNKIGQNINIDGKYLIQSYEVLHELTTEITHVLWRKFFPNELEHADQNLMEITYDLIYFGKYKLAQRLLSFSCQSYVKHHDDVYKFIFIVNRALSYHLDGKDAECKNILSEYDWSAKSDEYKLANFVLNKDWDSALKIMDKFGKSKEWAIRYRDWPLFTKFRKTKKFLSKYQKIYGVNFLEETMTENIRTETQEE